MTSPKTIVESNVRPLLTGHLFHAPIEQMNLAERLEAYVVIQFVEKKVEERKELLRLRLLEDIRQIGTPTEQGGHTAEGGGIQAIREKRPSTKPDEKMLIQLLEKHSIPSEKAFDKVVTSVPSPSKIAKLVENGFIPEAEAGPLYKVVYALKVTPGQELRDLLKDAEGK